MKVLNKVFITTFFLLASSFVCRSMDSIPMDLLGSLAPEKKLHNKIVSSVSGSAKNPDHSHQLSGLAEQKAHTIEQAHTPDKDTFTIPKLPSVPKAIPETHVDSKALATLIHDESKKETHKDSSHTQAKNTSQDHDAKHDVDHTSDKVVDHAKEESVHKEKEETAEHKVDHDKKDEHLSKTVKHEDVKEKGVLYQDQGSIDDTETVVFNFEETDLLNVANYMETIHKIKFISEDVLSTAKDAKGLSGHKVTFRTNKVLTKKESWDLFLTFLHIAGLDVVPMAQSGYYKIVPFAKANSDTIPTYIGVDCAQLPDNDMIVRFVYFAESVEPSKISPILTKMQSGSAKLETFTELKALIFTDRACNIKSLMQIVKELDKSALPETLSVVKLKRANADDVINLYKSLKPSSGQQQPQRAWVPGRKEATLEYFPQDVSTFADKRTNSLILLGPEKGVRRIEEFVEKYIDVEVNRENPEIHTYPLQYTDAGKIQQTLSSIITYNAGNATAGQYGGVRNDMKLFGKMTIIAETQTNSLIINASQEDYDALKPLIDELDIPQKQVGIEVLIVTVADGKVKELGSQLSGPKGPHAPVDEHKKSQTFAQSIAAQTASLSGGVVTTTGGDTTNSPDYSIKSSLASLLGQVGQVGSLVVTFGQPIWSVFKVLNTIGSTHVIANPFLVASNNTKATLTIGTQRNVTRSEQLDNSGRKLQGFGLQNANLTVDITPQVNKGNIINLKIDITDNSFVLPDETSALTDNKEVHTSASVASGEVLVLGGIMTERYTSSTNGVPFLENVPVLGWFFKSKSKEMSREHFLVLICPKLLDPVDGRHEVDGFTQKKLIEANKAVVQIDEFDWFTSQKDPIQRAFFKEDTTKSFRLLDGKDRKFVSQDKSHKYKKNQMKSVGRQQQPKKKEKAKDRKKKKQPSLAPVSFDTDFIKNEEPVVQRTNSISNVVGQEGRQHV